MTSVTGRMLKKASYCLALAIACWIGWHTWCAVAERALTTEIEQARRVGLAHGFAEWSQGRAHRDRRGGDSFLHLLDRCTTTVNVSTGKLEPAAREALLEDARRVLATRPTLPAPANFDDFPRVIPAFELAEMLTASGEQRLTVGDSRAALEDLRALCALENALEPGSTLVEQLFRLTVCQHASKLARKLLPKHDDPTSIRREIDRLRPTGAIASGMETEFAYLTEDVDRTISGAFGAGEPGLTPTQRLTAEAVANLARPYLLGRLGSILARARESICACRLPYSQGLVQAAELDRGAQAELLPVRRMGAIPNVERMLRIEAETSSQLELTRVGLELAKFGATHQRYPWTLAALNGRVPRDPRTGDDLVMSRTEDRLILATADGFDQWELSLGGN